MFNNKKVNKIEEEVNVIKEQIYKKDSDYGYGILERLKKLELQHVNRTDSADIKFLKKENAKLKAIVAELVDYVYKDDK